jgi:hypothetical protein
MPPSDDVWTTYIATAAPPSDAGADHDSDTCVVPAVALNPVGAAGVVNGVDVTVELAAPTPTTLMADTRNSYAVAFVSPLTV